MFLEIDEKQQDRLALVDSDGKKMTYGQLQDFIEEMSAVLPDRCLVFLLCRNCVGAAAAYLAALANRVVPLMLGSAMDETLLSGLMDRYRPSFIWKPSESAGKQEKVVFSAFSYELIDCGENPCGMYDELSLLLPTSGSTGSPKLVRHSYDNLEANARNIAAFFQLKPSDRPMLDLPIQYTYGLSVLNSHIYTGATVLLSDLSMMQQDYWKFFREQEATSITGVPYTYEMLKRFRIFRMELPSLELLSAGGGKLEETLQLEYARFARETGRRFVITYGQTEGSARMAWLPPEDALDKIGSIGKAIPGGKIYLVDEQGRKIAEAGRIGEMVYEGPNVTLGYAACLGDLMRADERNGVLYTGDMARQDAEGYLYVVGRKARFLKLYGNRVSLDECEGILRRAFAVECACTGADDEMIVYVAGPADAAQLLRSLSEKTHIHQKAFQVRQVDSLPRNEAGKILYDRLKPSRQEE